MALQVSKDDLKKLFVHGIPPSAQPVDLLQLFEACTCACPIVEGDMKDRRGILRRINLLSLHSMCVTLSLVSAAAVAESDLS